MVVEAYGEYLEIVEKTLIVEKTWRKHGENMEKTWRKPGETWRYWRRHGVR